MNAEPVTVPPSVTLEEFVNDYVYEHHYKMFPVVDDGRLAGCITTQQVKQVPREQWGETTVGDLTAGCSEQNTIAPDDDAIHAFTRMNQHQVSRLMVVEDGRLAGILALKDLLQFLSLKLELEAEGAPAPPAIKKARDVAAPPGE